VSPLQVVWFLLIGVLLTAYAILDGFDLGAGFCHFLTKKTSERRAILSSIGPIWDGNEVWLLTGGGALFAAFPEVYATVFSALYLPLMLILFALIFRAVAIGFRNEVDSDGWRARWDAAFSVGSILPALLFGVALGNILRGLPLDESKTFVGTFFGLLNPYALLIGLLGLAMLATHGAAYLALKTEGELAARARRWVRGSWVAYLVLFILSVVAAAVTQGQLLANYEAVPWLWLVPLFALASVFLIGVFNAKGDERKTFVTSALSIAGLMGMCGVGLFPNLVPALGNPELSLTVANASSSPLTLKVMLIVALIGVPLVLAYTVWMYKIFSGKVQAQTEGY
jgi:cytochrome d ubiquinol oxidase subunit II